MNDSTSRLEAEIARAASDPEITGVVVAVDTGDGRFRWSGATGDLGTDRPFFIASTTSISRAPSTT